ncbi:MAG: hypothetical protein FE78DRAFT_33080 [Acidomyces sp. 'richmondensis']|nr:MAG: hypothetical protein FE78DRAFT_33080 [Acidomyces sp. 'richmondensis']
MLSLLIRQANTRRSGSALPLLASLSLRFKIGCPDGLYEEQDTNTAKFYLLPKNGPYPAFAVEMAEEVRYSRY